MFCPNCSNPVDQNASYCAHCGYAIQASAPLKHFSNKPDVPTYLLPAILVTLFCCQPFGIVAIVFAAIASSKLSSGDYQGAMDSSQNASRWCWLAFWCGLIPILLYVGFIIIASIAGNL